MAPGLDETDHFGIKHDETSGPRDPENLDPIVGFERATAAGRRVLEADLGIMGLLEGGEVSDGWFWRAAGLRAGLCCLARGAGR